jgi:DNA-binding LytR/AlgR family response regulator
MYFEIENNIIIFVKITSRMIKIAMLDDNKRHLKLYKNNLEATGKFLISVFADNTEDFYKAYEAKSDEIDLLILDIELTNESTSGIDIVMDLKKHTLFTSEDNGNYIREFEQLEDDFNIFVEHISKPFSDSFFLKKVFKIVSLIEHQKNKKIMTLELKDEIVQTDRSDIVMITTRKGQGSESNNKVVCFTNRKEGVLVDFSFEKRVQWNFDESQFVQVHKSYVVNKHHISKIVNRKIIIHYYNGNQEEINIGPDYYENLKSQLGLK